jgi:hypothetical protein
MLAHGKVGQVISSLSILGHSNAFIREDHHLIPSKRMILASYPIQYSFIYLFLWVSWAMCSSMDEKNPSYRDRPPSTPPAELMDAYTMHGRMPIDYYYVDDTNSSAG